MQLWNYGKDLKINKIYVAYLSVKANFDKITGNFLSYKITDSSAVQNVATLDDYISNKSNTFAVSNTMWTREYCNSRCLFFKKKEITASPHELIVNFRNKIPSIRNYIINPGGHISNFCFQTTQWIVTFEVLSYG